MDKSEQIINDFDSTCEFEMPNMMSSLYGTSGSNSDIVKKPSLLSILKNRVMSRRFTEEGMEDMYQEYFMRQRWGALPVLIAFALLFDIAVIILYSMDTLSNKGSVITVQGIAFVCNLMLFFLCQFRLISDFSLTYIMPYAVWFLICGQTFADLLMYYHPIVPSSGVGWQIFFIFGLFVMLPQKLLTVLALNVVSSLTHCIIIAIKAKGKDIGPQIGANILLFACVILVGSISFLMLDKKQRRAFMETKRSLELKMKLDTERERQEDLMLSVLPKHIADDMVKSFGQENKGSFSRIYISRHESVSILFADIVGFTAMSSKLTSQELVKTLNALFANFDKLAETNHQLRIKILGDCYYCICGVPDPIQFHADYSVQMGLDMVVAIAAVREQTQSGVDMRVGIHTGAVLAGVMGQRQWQFDVWSDGVKLANCMESGGIPGRVHISQTTYDCLSDDFEVEPGDGETRSDYIKMQNMKTYLIKPVKDKKRSKSTALILTKPTEEKTSAERTDDDDIPVIYLNNTAEVNKNSTLPENLDKDGISDIDLKNAKNTDSKTVKFSKEVEQINSKEDCSNDNKLKEALIEREDASIMHKKVNTITLRFKDNELEQRFHHEKERQSAVAIFCSVIIMLFAFFAQLCVLPRLDVTFITFGMAMLVLGILFVISLATNIPNRFPPAMVEISNDIETTRWARILISTLVISAISIADVVDTIYCQTDGNYTSTPSPTDPQCVYAQYFNYIAILVLIGITVLIQITHLVKLLLMTLTTIVYCLINLCLKPELYSRYDNYLLNITENKNIVPSCSKYALTLQVVVASVALLYFNRHLDAMIRRLFYFKTEAKIQKQKVEELRTKNDLLIRNIMPAHVAQHFMGGKKQDEELYSQDYNSVGVMFASIPNFSDFYSEDEYNNQGTECLRFLNEIISDFDELLSRQQFRTVTKIKTISSTYMAASGLAADNFRAVYQDDKVTWHHLADLLEFALTMKQTLETINNQSFNNFILRIGINHGPILAGVIGARKPHYDIWGNTVNVSSRMESTGELDKIQVIASTKDILRKFGYTFKRRGIVRVKGKGELETFFYDGKDENFEQMRAVDLPNSIPCLL